MTSVEVEIPLVAADRAKIQIGHDAIHVLFGLGVPSGAVPQCQVQLTPALARALRDGLDQALAELERATVDG